MVTPDSLPPHLELNGKRVVSYHLLWHNSWESSDRTSWCHTSVSKPIPLPRAMCVLIDQAEARFCVPGVGTDSVSLEWGLLSHMD